VRPTDDTVKVVSAGHPSPRRSTRHTLKASDEVGLRVGFEVGAEVGTEDGTDVGSTDGLKVGVKDGLNVGSTDGLKVGLDSGNHLTRCGMRGKDQQHTTKAKKQTHIHEEGSIEKIDNESCCTMNLS
jgi:hypothetical protein